jgi:dihydrofolate reductase
MNMRKISAGLFISLDGVVEFPDRWGFRYMDKDMSEAIVAGIAQADAVLLGQSDHVPMARFLNHSPKYVVSRTPDKVDKLEWGPATLLNGDLGSELAKLRAVAGKTIQVPGSPKLVRTLLLEGLLDELSLTICPEVVGSGMRLFDQVAKPVTLTVEQSKVHGNGAISVTYRAARSGEQAAVQPLNFPAAASR